MSLEELPGYKYLFPSLCLTMAPMARTRGWQEALSCLTPLPPAACSCLPVKEAARHANLKSAIAARDFVEAVRGAGAMSPENSSPGSTALPSLLGNPQAGDSATFPGLHKDVDISFCSSSGRNDASPVPMSSSLQLATRVLLPLGCLQRSSQEHGDKQTTAEELGDESQEHRGRLHHPSTVAVVRIPTHALQLSCGRASDAAGPPPCGWDSTATGRWCGRRLANTSR